jgi:predicted metal-dependent hydrolase
MGEQHPVEYLAYLHYMNVNDYFEAHEVLEGYWHGERIDFYKGLIQVAVGLFHLNNGNIVGARALMQRAHELLTPYAPEFRALNVTRILAYLQDCLVRIPMVVELEREEVRALGIEPLRLWLEDGTEIPDEVVLPEEDEG